MANREPVGALVGLIYYLPYGEAKEWYVSRGYTAGQFRGFIKHGKIDVIEKDGMKLYQVRGPVSESAQGPQWPLQGHEPAPKDPTGQGGKNMPSQDEPGAFLRHMADRRSFRGEEERAPLAQLHVSELTLLLQIADIHHGGLGTNYKLMLEHIEQMTSHPSVYYIFNGDMIQNFSEAGKLSRKGAKFDCPTIDQYRAAEDWLNASEAEDRCVLAVLGNHDHWGDGGERLRRMFEDRGVPVGEHEGGLQIHCSGLEDPINVAVRHSYRGTSKHNETYAAHNLYEQGDHRIFGDRHPDIIMTAHLHTWGYSTAQRNGKMRHFSCGGSYKTDFYTRSKGFQDALPCFPAYLIWPDGGIECFNSISRAVPVLRALGG